MGGIYFVRRRRPHPLLVAYRWRYELGGSAAAVATWVGLGDSAEVGTVGGIAAGAVALAWAPARAVARRAIEHVIVQHRLRTGFLQAALTNRDGRMPRIMHARTRGETVTVAVWLPAGLAAEDVEAAAGMLASACGAAAVTVAPGVSRDRIRIVVERPRWGLPGG
jgi:hypothetical protein